MTRSSRPPRNLTSPRAYSTARQRLGLRREAPLCGAPDTRKGVAEPEAPESGAAAALGTAVQDAHARIVTCETFAAGISKVRATRQARESLS